MDFYRQQRSCGKAMLSQASVILFTKGREGVSVPACATSHMTRDVSLQGGLCPGGSLSQGISVWRGVSVQRVPVWGVSVQGVSVLGICLVGLCLGISVKGSLSRGSLSWGLCLGDLCPVGSLSRGGGSVCRGRVSVIC